MTDNTTDRDRDLAEAADLNRSRRLAEPVFDHAVRAVTSAVRAVTEHDARQLDLELDDLAETWLTLDDTMRQLGVLVNDLAVVVGEMLADMPYERKDGYRLPSGELVHHAQRSTERWEGRRLLLDLSATLVDPDTGEQVPAIPTDVLCDIVPGTADDKLTSSKWRIGGLSNLGVDPDDYRSREWRPARVQRGPGR